MNKINYAWPVTTLDRHDLEALKKCVESNRSIFDSKEIVIFGAGIRGTTFSLFFELLGYNNLAFVDNNKEKVGGVINQYNIYPYEYIVDHSSDIVVVISVEGGTAISQQLKESGLKENLNYFYIENNLYDYYVDTFLDEKKVDYLLMGDCGITDISKEDTNYESLGEMFKNGMSDASTKVLAIHAMNMRAFFHVLETHIQCVSVPRNVIVMANFETFTGKQHLLPRSQHAALIKKLVEATGRCNGGLEEYAAVTQERFSNIQIDYFASSQSAKKNMTRERNDRIVIMMNYMYSLKLDIEPIIYMNRIIELCRDNAINISFFVPPANYEYARELYGNDFDRKYEANLDLLKLWCDNKQCRLLDLSYILNKSEFANVHTIDETANYTGRIKVCDALIDLAKDMEKKND